MFDVGFDVELSAGALEMLTTSADLLRFAAEVTVLSSVERRFGGCRLGASCDGGFGTLNNVGTASLMSLATCQC